MAITTTMRTQVSQLYVSLFGRAPDAGGLGYWVGQLDSGKSVQTIAQDMYNVDAARAYYPASLTNSEIVSKFYSNVLNRTGDAEGVAYWTAKLNTPGYTKGALVVDMIQAVTSYAGTDAAALTAQALFNNKVETGLYYGFTLNSNDIAGSSQIIANVTADPSSVTTAKALYPATVVTAFNLGVAVDNIIGTAGDDAFSARIVNNSNTLQSNDKIAGGAGNDRLDADIGNSQAFAIAAETTGVETIAIRAQAVAVDTNNNNMTDPTAYGNQVQIDAQRMKGVLQWESNNSRADVVIEDVRINDNQITKDITIAMVETDPGNVDFGVYFDQYSLRAQANSASTLTLQIMDTRSNAAGTGALLDSPYNGFAFNFTAPGSTTPKLITVKSQAIDDAQTYAAMVTAIDAAIKLIPELASFTVALGGSFQVSDTLGSRQTGTEIVLKSTAGGTVSAVGAGTGWLANGAVPSSSGLHTNISTTLTNTTDKVTSKVILDDVGRGSTGGDLVIGGLSVGDTSTSRGVERFEIEVRDNSKLQTINSTNNTLQEVTVKNGVTTSTSFAYVTTTKDAGDLTVRGTLAANAENVALPGSAAQHNTYGFSDVRLIDASAMTGKFNFNAEITAASIPKYMNLVDVQTQPAPDTNNAFGAIANYQYTGGANNDTMIVDIDGTVASSRSTLIAGREDFTLAVDGGAGNDAITVTVVNKANAGGAQNWYNNQDLNNNITVNGGAGDDTIRTPGAGDLVIDGGAGVDVIYTDNTGFQTVSTVGAAGNPAVAVGFPAPLGATSEVKAVWVYNTADQISAAGTAAAFANRNINDIRSDTNESFNLYNSNVVVTFKGLPSVTIQVGSTGYKTSDLQINQAIKLAINTDPTLKTLLVAKDGPANSLVIESLIDGTMATTDLNIALTIPALTTLSVADIAGAGAVYLAAGTVATEANVLAAMAVAKAQFDFFGDYATQFANDGAITIVGAPSASTSDNLVTGGTGNDVIVLGTTVGLTAATSSNETLKYDASGFGSDVVVNFAATGFGVDHFDFTGIGGLTYGAANYTTDKSINVEVIDVNLATTKAAIEAKFNANNLVAQKHVFVAVSTHNVGTVYVVEDGIGATNAVATIAGTIDLADTAWTSLTAGNFVNSGTFQYSLVEGPTGLVGVVVPPVVVPGVATPVAVNAAAALSAAGGDFTYNVAMGNYAATIAGFGTNDKIVSPAGVTGTLNNASFTDGSATVQYAAAGQVATITLTGLTNAQDAQLFGTSDLNTVFGAGTFA